MSRRKPPVTTKAQREQMADEWVKLREKIGDRMREAHEAHMYAYGALLNLELLFGQPPKPPESLDRAAMVNVPRQYGATQTVTPPAPAWRSMASAPRDGREILVRVNRRNWIASFRESYWWIDDDFGRCDEDLIAAWAPIPEWTGEVAE